MKHIRLTSHPVEDGHGALPIHWGRADPRALIGISLTLIALAGSVSFWVGSSEAHPVIVATRDLPIGAANRRDDLRLWRHLGKSRQGGVPAPSAPAAPAAAA